MSKKNQDDLEAAFSLKDLLPVENDTSGSFSHKNETEKTDQPAHPKKPSEVATSSDHANLFNRNWLLTLIVC